MNRPKRTARKVYDHLSPIYDLLAGPSEAALVRLGLESLDISPGEHLLEIGPGTGKALVQLSVLAGQTGSVHAIDLSRGMLLQARNRLAKHGVVIYRLVEGDGAWLPYAGERFSAVFLSFTLELFDAAEIPIVLGECRRVIQPGGRLGLVALYEGEVPRASVRLYEWFHQKWPDYVDCRPINAGAMLQDCGFRLEKRLVKGMWGLPVEILTARKA